MASVFRRDGHTYWQARLKFSHRNFGANYGRWFQRSTGKTEKVKAEKVCAAWQTVLDAGIDPFEVDRIARVGALTLERLESMYFHRRGLHLESGTQELYRNTFRLLRERFGNIDVARIDGGVIADFAQWRSASVEVATTNIDLRNIRTILRWAVQENALYGFVIPKIQELKSRKRKQHNHYTSEELKALMSQGRAVEINGVRLDLYWTFLVLTAMRTNEALALKWEDVNRTDGVIRVVNRKRRQEERDVPLSAAIQAILNALPVQGERLFPIALGSSHLKKRFHQARIAAGIERRLTMHNFRATAIYNMFRAGMGLKEVQEIVGHADPDTTMRYYLTVNLKEKHSAMERYDNFFGADLVHDVIK